MSYKTLKMSISVILLAIFNISISYAQNAFDFNINQNQNEFKKGFSKSLNQLQMTKVFTKGQYIVLSGNSNIIKIKNLASLSHDSLCFLLSYGDIDGVETSFILANYLGKDSIDVTHNGKGKLNRIRRPIKAYFYKITNSEVKLLENTSPNKLVIGKPFYISPVKVGTPPDTISAFFYFNDIDGISKLEKVALSCSQYVFKGLRSYP